MEFEAPLPVGCQLFHVIASYTSASSFAFPPTCSGINFIPQFRTRCESIETRINCFKDKILQARKNGAITLLVHTDYLISIFAPE
jgi:hypothetical protein